MDYINKDVIGVAAVYIYGSRLIVLAGWSLLVFLLLLRLLIVN
jgi:hypothetical protein